MKSDSKAPALPSLAANTPAQANRELMTDAEEVTKRALKDKGFLRALHGQGFSGVVMRTMYENIASGKLFGETCQDFQIDVLSRMEARDPLEQMLIDQMLWTHMRIGKLSMVAVQQTNLKQVQIVHEATDRALNAFRRQMLALQEYRTPKPAPSFTAIKQQNIALMNGSEAGKSQIKTVTNEKETAHGQEPNKALPADTGSIGLPSEFHPAGQAVAGGNRAADGGWQGA